MSLATLAILTACDEVIAGTIGSVRTITAGDYLPGVYDDQELAESQLLMSTKARAETRFAAVSPHQARATAKGSRTIYQLAIVVDVRRAFTLESTMVHTTRRIANAAAAADASAIAEALEWRNLSQTSAAVSTDLASAQLVWDGSDIGGYEIVSDRVGRIHSTHKFHGIAIVTVPTS